MRIRNVHTRALDATAAEVGALLDGLAGPDDRLWPNGRWPAMRLDGPLEPGSRGGHGPVRYAVAERGEPGGRDRHGATMRTPARGGNGPKP